MRRHIPGLHEAATNHEQQIPDGFFLVRVEKATYRAYKDKPFLALQLSVLEPRQFSALSVFRPPLLHQQGPLETQLVPARFRL